MYPHIRSAHEISVILSVITNIDPSVRVCCETSHILAAAALLLFSEFVVMVTFIASV